MNLSHGAESECKHQTEVEVNIDDIEVYFDPDHKNVIQITDEMGMKFKDPSLSDVVGINSNQDDEYDLLLEVISRCIVCVYEEDEVYDDFTMDEAKVFLSSMTQEQFVKLEDFFNTIPKLRHEIKWTCSECGEEDSVVLEGLQSFFT